MNNKQLLVAVFGTEKLPISEIEAFTEQYPWCAMGHKLLFAALCAQGNEAYVSHLPKTAVYVFNRAELLTIAKTSPLEPASESVPVPEPPPIPECVSKPVPDPEVESMPEVVPASASEPVDTFMELVSDFPEQRVMVVGGDYFGSADFKALPLEEKNPVDRFIKLNPRMLKVQPQEDQVSLLEVSDDDFMTETLAKIYVEQSLHQLAREAYKKLILLYPKKSDYFAALIQEIKLKTNR